MLLQTGMSDQGQFDAFDANDDDRLARDECETLLEDEGLIGAGDADVIDD